MTHYLKLLNNIINELYLLKDMVLYFFNNVFVYFSDISGFLSSLNNAQINSPLPNATIANLGEIDTMVYFNFFLLIVCVFLIFAFVIVLRHKANDNKDWYVKLSYLEDKLNKSQAILQSYGGLLVVWESHDKIDEEWGAPQILGSSSAFASLIILNHEEGSPLDMTTSLLRNVCSLPLHEKKSAQEILHGTQDNDLLGERLRALHNEGKEFLGMIVTKDGREIEVIGGSHVGLTVLWLADPVSKMVNGKGFVNSLQEKTQDLYGAQSLLDKFPYPVWRRDNNCQLIWINSAYLEAVGVKTAKEVINQQIELDDLVVKLAHQAMEVKQDQSQIIPCNIKGKRKYLKIIEQSLNKTADSSLGGIAIDVTEIELLKEKLVMNEETTSTMLDHINSAVVIFNYKQELDYYNDAFAKLWKFGDADLIGQISHGEILDILYQRQLLPEQSDYNKFRLRLLEIYDGGAGDLRSAKDGGNPDEIWHCNGGQTLSVTMQRHPNGGVIWVVDDITEKISLETQYNILIKVQKATINSLAEAVCVFGLNGRLRLSNISFKKMFALDDKFLASEVTIDKLIEIIKNKTDKHEDSLVKLRQKIVSLNAEDRASMTDCILYLNDDRYLSISTQPLPDGASLIAINDITDTKKRELGLSKRNELLQDVDQMKSKFISFLSYHLRTPLNTIIGFGELLNDEIFGSLNEKQKDYTTSIVSASNQLLDMSNDIIDLATIDAGKLELEKTSINIRKLMEIAASHVMLKAEDTQIDLKLDCAMDIGDFYADEGRLRQVLFNLISNAFSQSKPGGSVTLGALKKSKEFYLYVSNSGFAFDKKLLQFGFANNKFIEKGDEKLIGIALVKSIVELHQGQVYIINDKEIGNTIFCKFPIQEQIKNQISHSLRGSLSKADVIKQDIQHLKHKLFENSEMLADDKKTSNKKISAIENTSTEKVFKRKVTN